MGTTPVPVITEAGMTIPDFSECLSYYESLFKGIYGQDLYWDPDDRDQQFMAQMAEALYDVNSSILSVFNGFSPTSAQKASLSRLVKINGISRLVASYSSAPVIIGGQTGTIIENGLVRDAEGVLWALPEEVVIPASGQITVTAVCTQLGAIRAPARTINQMATLVAGWQSVVNPTDAAIGAPIESDAYLRARQAISTALPSETVLDKLRGAIAGIDGVSKSHVYENDTALPDERGIPGHSIAVVVSGGTVADISRVIVQGKGSGVRTHGNTTSYFSTSSGTPQVVRYSRPVQALVSFQVTIQPKKGFDTNVQNFIKQSLSNWVNDLMFGDTLTRMDAVVKARLSDTPYASAFSIRDLLMSKNGVTPSTDDVVLAFNEEAYCAPAYVNVRLVP